MGTSDFFNKSSISSTNLIQNLRYPLLNKSLTTTLNNHSHYHICHQEGLKEIPLILHQSVHTISY